ncbi:hypothetical protein [Desulfonema magnum]|uniref:Uncharacterized protein n=1 Tax=Desulfonema magnum TaxID=45655 RepID=A0A975BW33_9BACT|nr:hypothetical protein [Desulfonema magnum]QTA92452.1 Uncharacterized protein dnm_085320 [Desulfonema magnum]
MKDERGLYYHPFPQNTHVRMYVRETGEGTCFRLWNSDDPNLWEEHGWVSYDAIRQASAMYKGEGFNPNEAYDIEVARELLRKTS